MTQTPEVDESVLKRLPMTKLLRDRLTVALGDGYSLAVGAAPRTQVVGSNPPVFVGVDAPYVILYPLWTNTSGTWSQPDADAEWLYQASMFGKRWDQNEWMRDRLVSWIFSRTPDGQFRNALEVEGMRVMDRSIRDDTGYAPDNAVPSGIIQSDLRFSLKVTPYAG
jgi:hypothetical protein